MTCGTASAPRRRRQMPGCGFTTIEIMVAVALVGVLATLALPSYGTYVARARLLDGAIRLSDHRAKMEQYYLDRRSYVDGGGDCGIPIPPVSRDDAFDVACTATASTYRIVATGRAAGGMNGFALAVDETGQRTTLAVPAGWTRSADCWTTRPDGTCL